VVPAVEGLCVVRAVLRNAAGVGAGVVAWSCAGVGDGEGVGEVVGDAVAAGVGACVVTCTGEGVGAVPGVKNTAVAAAAWMSKGSIVEKRHAPH